MRCPTCGETVMIHGSRWECGWCCDCGDVPGSLLEPTPESLAKTAGPDAALLLRTFSETLGA